MSGRGARNRPASGAYGRPPRPASRDGIPVESVRVALRVPVVLSLTDDTGVEMLHPSSGDYGSQSGAGPSRPRR